MNQTAGDGGFLKAQSGMSESKTRTGSTGAHSFAMPSNQTTMTLGNKNGCGPITATEIIQNLNPVTKKYL